MTQYLPIIPTGNNPQLASPNAQDVNNPSPSSILRPSNLTSSLSNANSTLMSGILDFTIFNPYIHYLPKSTGGAGVLPDFGGNALEIPFQFNVFTALTKFNTYSSKYRNM